MLLLASTPIAGGGASGVLLAAWWFTFARNTSPSPNCIIGLVTKLVTYNSDSIAFWKRVETQLHVRFKQGFYLILNVDSSPDLLVVIVEGSPNSI